MLHGVNAYKSIDAEHFFTLAKHAYRLPDHSLKMCKATSHSLSERISSVNVLLITGTSYHIMLWMIDPLNPSRTN